MPTPSLLQFVQSIPTLAADVVADAAGEALKDHLDIKTAFLNGILPPDEQFFCSPPPGFPLPAGFCWQLKRGLYGAHQSGAIWSSTFRTWVKTTLHLFTEAGAERCVFVKRQHADGTMVDLEKLRDITSNRESA
jgi:hypothetical protein